MVETPQCLRSLREQFSYLLSEVLNLNVGVQGFYLLFETQQSDNNTPDSRKPGQTKLEVGIGAKDIVSFSVSYSVLQENVNSLRELMKCKQKRKDANNSSISKEVWALLGVWAEIQNNFSIFPNSSPLLNYSSQTNVLLPSESRQSRKEIIRHFHLKH